MFLRNSAKFLEFSASYYLKLEWWGDDFGKFSEIIQIQIVEEFIPEVGGVDMI